DRVAGAVVVPLALVRILEDERRIDGESVFGDRAAVTTAPRFEHQAAEFVADETESSAAERREVLADEVARTIEIEPDERHVVAFGVRHHDVRKAAVVQRTNGIADAIGATHRPDDEALRAELAKALDLLFLAVEPVRARREQQPVPQRVGA